MGEFSFAGIDRYDCFDRVTEVYTVLARKYCFVRNNNSDVVKV